MNKIRTLPVTFDDEESSSIRTKPVSDESFEDFSTTEVLKDVAKQGAKGFVKGRVGTIGSILDLLGLQASEQLPGEKTRNKIQHEILTKMEKPGYVPSYGEMMLLTEDDIAYPSNRLASSSDVGSLIEELGGPGKGKTFTGRLAERAGEFLGGAPRTKLTEAVIPAVAGQLAEESGAPGWVQAAAEITAFLKMRPKSAHPVSSRSPEVQEELKRLREMGFSEKDITLAKSSLEKNGILKSVATESAVSQRAFETNKQSMQNNINQILNSAFPGLEHGVDAMKKGASNAFENVKAFGREVKVTDPEPFLKAVNSIKKELKRTLANTSEQKSAIGILNKASKKILPPPKKVDVPLDQSKIIALFEPLEKIPEEVKKKILPADYYINFYQSLNDIGRWLNPGQKERMFAKAKKGLVNSLYASGEEGEHLAREFQTANKEWINMLNADEASNIIKRATTDQGIDYKKLYAVMNEPGVRDKLTKTMGEKSVDNLTRIGRIGEKIGNLEAAIKGGTLKDSIQKGMWVNIFHNLAAMDPEGLTRALGLGTGQRITQYIATQMLTNSDWQNLIIKALTAIEKDSPKIAQSVIRTMQSDL